LKDVPQYKQRLLKKFILFLHNVLSTTVNREQLAERIVPCLAPIEKTEDFIKNEMNKLIKSFYEKAFIIMFDHVDEIFKSENV